MKGFIVGISIALVLIGFAQAAEPVYTLRAITDWEKDPIACARDGGQAAQVANIGENGYLSSDWEFYCLLPATK